LPDRKVCNARDQYLFRRPPDLRRHGRNQAHVHQIKQEKLAKKRQCDAPWRVRVARQPEANRFRSGRSGQRGNRRQDFRRDVKPV